jgi:acyl-CoA reductase-like NAD-dependent aldehyde dehydrogenase
VRRLAPVLCGGNTVVALGSEEQPVPALTFGEVLATSDFPAGVVNVLSGLRRELLSWLGAHMDVNAIDCSGCNDEEAAELERLAAVNVKRVVRTNELSPYAITAFTEMKTVWHPIGT